MRARYYLAECYRHSGELIKSLTILGEIYVATKSKPELFALANESYCYYIRNLIQIQKVEDEMTEERLSRIMEIIQEGLQWLLDIGKYECRGLLLINLADVLWSLGKKDQALVVSEEAYRLKLKDPDNQPASFGSFASELAKYARLLGYYDRSLQVLKEIEEHSHRYHYDQYYILNQLGLTFLEMEPPKLMEATDVARRLVRIMRDCEAAPSSNIAYYETVSCIFIANQLYQEASESLHKIHELALRDESFLRPCVLRMAKNAFHRSYGYLNIEGDRFAEWHLHQELEEWMKDRRFDT